MVHIYPKPPIFIKIEAINNKIYYNYTVIKTTLFLKDKCYNFTL